MFFTLYLLLQKSVVAICLLGWDSNCQTFKQKQHLAAQKSEFSCLLRGRKSRTDLCACFPVTVTVNLLQCLRSDDCASRVSSGRSTGTGWHPLNEPQQSTSWNISSVWVPQFSNKRPSRGLLLGWLFHLAPSIDGNIQQENGPKFIFHKGTFNKHLYCSVAANM